MNYTTTARTSRKLPTAPNSWLLIVIVSAICSIICIISFTTIIYNLCVITKKSSKKIHKSTKYYSILSVISFTISAITAATSWFLIPTELMLEGDPPLYHKYITSASMRIASNFTWYLGLFFLYLLWLSRLKNTYIESVYKISMIKYVILCCTLSTSLLLLIASTALFFWGYFQNLILTSYTHNSAGIFTKLYPPIAIATECTHFIISITLLYMFVSRLLQLHVLRRANTMYDSIGLESKRHRILNAATKYAVLCVTAIVSSQINLITSMLLSELANIDDHYYWNGNYIIMATISEPICPLDCAINCICIVLSFSSKNGIYSILCNKCDKCCKYICMEYVKRKIKEVNHRAISHSDNYNHRHHHSTEIMLSKTKSASKQMEPLLQE